MPPAAQAIDRCSSRARRESASVSGSTPVIASGGAASADSGGEGGSRGDAGRRAGQQGVGPLRRARVFVPRPRRGVGDEDPLAGCRPDPVLGGAAGVDHADDQEGIAADPDDVARLFPGPAQQVPGDHRHPGPRRQVGLI
ncbi:MAG: hypothetical protein U1F77_16805 [Kiritimatiellia bacterium]